MKRHPITDHAVIRFCERVKGIDMNDIRDQIATPELVTAIALGAKVYRSDGVVYKIKDGRVTTITEERALEEYKPTKRQRRAAKRRITQ